MSIVDVVIWRPVVTEGTCVSKVIRSFWKGYWEPGDINMPVTNNLFYGGFLVKLSLSSINFLFG